VTTWFVTIGGNDTTGNGTSGNPYATVSKANSVALTGDTINIGPGTFTWQQLTFTQSTLTIVGAPGYPLTTIMDGASAQTGWQSPGVIGISQIAFQNAIGNGGANSAFSDSGNNDVGATLNFTNCSFFNIVQINNTNGAFALLRSVNSAMSFTACLFYDIPAITGGTNAGAIVQVQHNGTWTFTNCTWYTNISSTITYVIFVANGGVTMSISLTNCIFHNANGVGVAFSSGTISFSGTNNDILGYNSPPSLANQISTDPLFVDPTNGNFNLRPTSPCIDAGAPI
jgi:hypothetical protein